MGPIRSGSGRIRCRAWSATTLTDTAPAAVPVRLPRATSGEGRAQVAPAAKSAKLPGAAGRWIAPTALVLLGLGLAWIVVFYLAGNDIPVMKSLDNWNLLIGMGLITSGFVVLTRWK